MYGIYANIGGILMVNVTIYSIHGSYGVEKIRGIRGFHRAGSTGISGMQGFQQDADPPATASFLLAFWSLSLSDQPEDLGSLLGPVNRIDTPRYCCGTIYISIRLYNGTYLKHGLYNGTNDHIL